MEGRLWGVKTYTVWIQGFGANCEGKQMIWFFFKKGYSKNYDTACEADMEGNEWSILHYGAVVCEAAGCVCAILGHITVKNATKPK